MRITNEARRISWVAAALGICSLVGCSLTDCSLLNRPPEFTSTPGWVTENIDPSFWIRMGRSAPATAFRDFWIFAEDPDGVDDITFVQVTDPLANRYVLQDTENDISFLDGTGTFWGGFRALYDADSPSTITLGVYDVLVRDSRSHQLTGTIPFTGPGGAPASGFLYDETTYGGPTSGGTPMLRRATSVGGTWVDAASLRIDFSVNDSRVNNGYLWFFDASGGYLAGSGYFRDTVNGGTGVNTAGPNSFTLHQTDLDLGTHSFSEVRGVHVVLVDGSQYAPDHQEWWDHRSISAYATF